MTATHFKTIRHMVAKSKVVFNSELNRVPEHTN